MKKDYLLSIIVPVFRVERFISKCAHSLFSQSLSGIQFIFIDDKGGDKSIEVLREVLLAYPERNEDTLIMTNPRNLGSSESRNVGLTYASGKYVTFCDADDWVELRMAEVVLDKMIKEEADIVWTDFYLSNKDSEVRVSQNYAEDAIECIKGLLTEQFFGSLWNKMFRRDLFIYNNVLFPSRQDVWEDLLTNVQLFHFSKKVVYLSEAFYHYVQYNDSSLVKIRNDKQLSDILANSKSIITFLSDEGVLSNYENEIPILKLAAKQTLLYQTDRASFKKWREIYPESNKDISNYDKLPKHLRFVGKAADRKCWLVVGSWIFLKRIKNSLFSKA